MARLIKTWIKVRVRVSVRVRVRVCHHCPYGMFEVVKDAAKKGGAAGRQTQWHSLGNFVAEIFASGHLVFCKWFLYLTTICILVLSSFANAVTFVKVPKAWHFTYTLIMRGTSILLGLRINGKP